MTTGKENLPVIHLVLGALLAASNAFGANESALNCQLEVTAKGSLAAAISARAEERAGGPVEVVYSSVRPQPGQTPEISFTLVKKDGGMIAEFVIMIRRSTMQILKLDVTPSYRRLGISELFMLHALSRHPEIKRIETALLETNWDVMQAALNEGKSCVEALKATPSWRMRERIGFTVMKEADCVFLPGYVAERP